MKYNIGALLFTTKKECEQYVRNKLYLLGCCHIDINHIDWVFFNDLIKNHPEYLEKKGVGVEYFEISQTISSYALNIRRVDNSYIDISWIYCCFKYRPEKQSLLDAMRFAIYPSIRLFRNSNDILQCQLCGINDINATYEIDHDNPSFLTLSTDFIASNNDFPSLFDDHQRFHNAIFKKENADYERHWILYHNTNCNLQVLCKKCNRRKK